MFARVFTAAVRADELDDMIGLVKNAIIPAAKTQPGFRGLWFLTDAASGRVKLISHWASEADRTASETNGFLREQLSKLGEFVTAPPTVDRWVISTQS